MAGGLHVNTHWNLCFLIACESFVLFLNCLFGDVLVIPHDGTSRFHLHGKRVSAIPGTHTTSVQMICTMTSPSILSQTNPSTPSKLNSKPLSLSVYIVTLNTMLYLLRSCFTLLISGRFFCSCHCTCGWLSSNVWTEALRHSAFFQPLAQRCGGGSYKGIKGYWLSAERQNCYATIKKLNCTEWNSAIKWYVITKNCIIIVFCLQDLILLPRMALFGSCVFVWCTLSLN